MPAPKAPPRGNYEMKPMPPSATPQAPPPPSTTPRPPPPPPGPSNQAPAPMPGPSDQTWDPMPGPSRQAPAPMPGPSHQRPPAPMDGPTGMNIPGYAISSNERQYAPGPSAGPNFSRPLPREKDGSMTDREKEEASERRHQESQRATDRRHDETQRETERRYQDNKVFTRRNLVIGAGLTVGGAGLVRFVPQNHAGLPGQHTGGHAASKFRPRGTNFPGDFSGIPTGPGGGAPASQTNSNQYMQNATPNGVPLKNDPNWISPEEVSQLGRPERPNVIVTPS